MVSKVREIERELRVLVLEVIKIAISTGHHDIAKDLGEFSAKLNERIKSYDYSKEDDLHDKVEKIYKGKKNDK